MHKTEMRQKSPPKKVRQMTWTKLKCVKNHPLKMRQKSCKNALKITPQINASKITPKKSASKFTCVKIHCVKDH
jgi:hypothetical protein